MILPKAPLKPSHPNVILTTPQVLWITITEAHDGQRLDNFLTTYLKGVPHSHVYQIIRSGEVRVNKHRIKAHHRLVLGDVVRVPPTRVRVTPTPSTSTSTSTSLAPSTAPDLPILWEDDAFLVLNKPADLAVHGGSGVRLGVIEWLRHLRPEARFLELVHRLDRGTSGLLLVAKRRSALVALQDQFRDRTTQKIYRALVLGTWPASLRHIHLPLYKYVLANGDRRVEVVSEAHPYAKPSISMVTPEQVWHPSPPYPDKALSLLNVYIKTGRTHQIRVHLAHHGHPIVGDDKYGDFAQNKVYSGWMGSRLYLHAWRLRLVHPQTHQPLQWEAPMPLEFTPWLKQASMPLTPPLN